MAANPIDSFEIWTLIVQPYQEEKSYETAVAEYDTYIQSRKEPLQVELNCGIQSENYDRNETKKVNISEIATSPEEFNVPVYIGIGLRLKANVTVLKGSVNLSSLPALTAAVEAGSATGTMSVQTIGISGKSARSNLLLLDKIDSTTIQNAIQVLASIKASIDSSDTTITPRIVGFHNTIGAGPQGINMIHSLISGANYKSGLLIDDSLYATGPLQEQSDTGITP